MCGVSWTQRHPIAAGVYSEESAVYIYILWEERLSVSAESTESHRLYWESLRELDSSAESLSGDKPERGVTSPEGAGK